MVAALTPGLVAYAQLCDGPLLPAGGEAMDPARYAEEAFDRPQPGRRAGASDNQPTAISTKKVERDDSTRA